MPHIKQLTSKPQVLVINNSSLLVCGHQKSEFDEKKRQIAPLIGFISNRTLDFFFGRNMAIHQAQNDIKKVK